LPGKTNGTGVEVPELKMTLPVEANLPASGTDVLVGMRPEHLHIEDGDALHIDLIEHLGGTNFVHLDTAGGTRIISEDRTARDRQRDTKVNVSLQGPAYIFEKDTGLRIR
ncbi:MAG: TOBE domain-containing protein, partial [Pseudomonadota bacterium]